MTNNLQNRMLRPPLTRTVQLRNGGSMTILPANESPPAYDKPTKIETPGDDEIQEEENT